MCCQTITVKCSLCKQEATGSPPFVRSCLRVNINFLPPQLPSKKPGKNTYQWDPLAYNVSLSLHCMQCKFTMISGKQCTHNTITSELHDNKIYKPGYTLATTWLNSWLHSSFSRSKFLNAEIPPTKRKRQSKNYKNKKRKIDHLPPHNGMDLDTVKELPGLAKPLSAYRNATARIPAKENQRSNPHPPTDSLVGLLQTTQNTQPQSTHL